MDSVRLKDTTLHAFTDALGSSLPAPGGGAAAGVSAALGAALGKMVSELTLNREKYAAFHPLCQKACLELEKKIPAFFELAQADADAYNGYMKAFRMPKTTEEEIRSRAYALELAVSRSTEVPCSMIQSCLETIGILEQMHRNSNPSVRGDLAAAACEIETAAKIAWLNILANLPSFADPDQADAIRKTYGSKLQEVSSRCIALYDAVEASL